MQIGCIAIKSVATKPESAMPWVLLVIAGLFEVAWAIGLKYTEGFTRLWPSAGTLAAMGLHPGLKLTAAQPGTAYLPGTCPV
jgi:hypothetical protein